MMRECRIPTKRGVMLDGVLFGMEPPARADTAVVAITGIHGNFCSNPFYVNMGQTLNAGGIDFVYAQTCDAFSRIQTWNARTHQEEVIGSWNESFDDVDDDVGAYVDFAESRGYRHIVLAGHSLGANKVIHYLSETHDARVERFLLLSPASVSWLVGAVTEEERECVRSMVERGEGKKMLPFPLLGWIDCIADTAWQWLFSGTLDNVDADGKGNFPQLARMAHKGALVIGTYDRFVGSDPVKFLEDINSRMPTARENSLVFIQKTGHTYQQKEQELAERVLSLVKLWRGERKAQEAGAVEGKA